MYFSKLLGNQSAKEALKQMLEQKRVPHTLLFYGPKGVGKSQFALSLAEYLMGPQSTNKLMSGNHPDLHLLYPEGKGALHPVENIRTMIKETPLPPFEAPVKVFIIHDAHQMLPASSNALLKTLEEPVTNTYFILITTELNSLLPTIISRACKVPFFPIPIAEMQYFIEEEWKKDSLEAKRIALLSQGSLAKAKLLVHQTKEGAHALIQSLFQLQLPEEYPRLVYLCDALEKLLLPAEEEIAENGSINYNDTILEEIFSWFRDLYILQNNIDARHLIHPGAAIVLKERAISSLETVVKELQEVQTALQRHIKPRVVFEHFFLNRALA